MRDVDVQLVMAMVAVSGARTRNELGLRSRRLELDYLAQFYESFLPTRASALSRTPASRMNPSASA
jgi:hypothetical protein